MKKLFILIISGTNTIKHPGISAAGADLESLQYTAALDAEFITEGRTISKADLPVSPNGIVSPALISKACLNLLNLDHMVFNLGAHIKPQIQHYDFKLNPSKSIETGEAMDPELVYQIFDSGQKWGFDLSQKYKQVIIAECVVGGTTSACGLLTTFDYNCSNMLSSSFPNGNHELKDQLITQGLLNLKKRKPNHKEEIMKDPLLGVAAMGDMSQAFIAGLATQIPNYILAGGTQMLAIASLLEKLQIFNSQIITTEWVYNDKSAKFKNLKDLVCPKSQITYNKLGKRDAALEKEVTLLSNNALSLKQITQRYDEGHVKEGVGMGALLYLRSQQFDNSSS